MTAELRTIDRLVASVEGNTQIIQKIKDDPVNALHDLADRIKKEHSVPVAAAEYKTTFRIAILVLGLVIIGVLGLIGYQYLTNSADKDIKIPEILVAMTSTALGALAGLLSPSVASQRR